MAGRSEKMASQVLRPMSAKVLPLKKKEWSRSMETAKKIERVEEARIGQAEGFPAALARCSSL
jgi:hypothetical protein